MTLTAWALTTGETGMRTQARGLAQAVADVVIEKTAAGWLWGSPRAAPVDRLAAPWPDILITCGRRSVNRAIAVRRASGGRTLTVHVQDPRGRADAFDLVIAMDHDRIAAGGNVMKVSTALHDLTPENLSEAGRLWAPRLAPLGRPLLGAVVGGDLKGRPFTRADGARLVTGLRALRAQMGAALAITPSRRTPGAVRQLLDDAFAGDPAAFVWNLEGDNPYRGILALSDRLVVTSDSVSMVSEALCLPRPVEILDLGFPRHTAFVQGLIDAGLARRFDGALAPARPPIATNATLQAAQAVKAMLQTRTGASG